MNRVQIKERAKTVLGNNLFGNAWLMVLIVLLIQRIANAAAASIIPGVGTLLIFGPLAYGVSVIMLKKIRTDEPVDFMNLFKGFTDDFAQTFVLGLLSSLFVALWSLLFVIPGIVKAYAYSMAFYVKADHPEYNWKACLDESIRITNGHKMELFVLDLSYIGWYIVGACLFGIGILWVAPYHSTANALYYEQLKNAQ